LWEQFLVLLKVNRNLFRHARDLNAVYQQAVRINIPKQKAKTKKLTVAWLLIIPYPAY